MKKILFLFVLSLFSFAGLQAKTLKQTVSNESIQHSKRVVVISNSETQLPILWCIGTLISHTYLGTSPDGVDWYRDVYDVTCVVVEF